MTNLPPIADEILSLYLEKTDTELPGFLTGFYIYGSISLGDFHPSKSDIDFIALTEKRPSREEILVLGKIHRAIQRKYRKPNMNGIYLPEGDIGLSEADIQPFPYFFEGRMHSSGKMELHRVTWYQLKNNSVTLKGDDPSRFNISVTKQDLLTEMKENVNSYWEKWIEEHSGSSLLKSVSLLLFEQKTEWGVLGVARQVYTADTGLITSKLRAGEYCRDTMPDEYKKILDEAIRIRKSGKKTLYRFNKQRKKDVLSFMNYAKGYITSLIP